MNKNIQEKIIDISGVQLLPGEPAVCLGNGEQGFECCVMNATIICIAFPNSPPKTKEHMAYRIRVIVQI